MDDDVAEKYNASAPHYDARYRSIQHDKYRYALSLIGPVEGRVLDVGCGTGLFAEYLGRRIEGIDISSGMLELASSRMNARCADATRIPFPSDAFDWVFSFTVLQNVSDYRTALVEIRRVMRTDGRCLLTYLDKAMFAPIGDAIEAMFAVEDRGVHGEDVFFLCTRQ